jgi:hypothetical protein
MRTEIFTVYDSAAKLFLEPFFAETVEVAIRMFRQLVNKPEHNFSKFAEDYTLFHVGTYDPTSGTIKALETPHSLGVAVVYINRPRLEAVNG